MDFCTTLKMALPLLLKLYLTDRYFGTKTVLGLYIQLVYTTDTPTTDDTQIGHLEYKNTDEEDAE